MSGAGRRRLSPLALAALVLSTAVLVATSPPDQWGEETEIEGLVLVKAGDDSIDLPLDLEVHSTIPSDRVRVLAYATASAMSGDGLGRRVEMTGTVLDDRGEPCVDQEPCPSPTGVRLQVRENEDVAAALLVTYLLRASIGNQNGQSPVPEGEVALKLAIDEGELAVAEVARPGAESPGAVPVGLGWRLEVVTGGVATDGDLVLVLGTAQDGATVHVEGEVVDVDREAAVAVPTPARCREGPCTFDVDIRIAGHTNDPNEDVAWQLVSLAHDDGAGTDVTVGPPQQLGLTPGPVATISLDAVGNGAGGTESTDTDGAVRVRLPREAVAGQPFGDGGPTLLVRARRLDDEVARVVALTADGPRYFSGDIRASAGRRNEPLRTYPWNYLQRAECGAEAAYRGCEITLRLVDTSPTLLDVDEPLPRVEVQVAVLAAADLGVLPVPPTVEVVP